MPQVASVFPSVELAHLAMRLGSDSVLTHVQVPILHKMTQTGDV